MSFEEAARENLLAVARAYAKGKNLSIATVSGHVHGNQAFLSEFAAGRCSVTLAKMAEMLKAFGERWPKGVEKPRLKAVPMNLKWKKIPEA